MSPGPAWLRRSTARSNVPTHPPGRAARPGAAARTLPARAQTPRRTPASLASSARARVASAASDNVRRRSRKSASGGPSSCDASLSAHVDWASRTALQAWAFAPAGLTGGWGTRSSLVPIAPSGSSARRLAESPGRRRSLLATAAESSRSLVIGCWHLLPVCQGHARALSGRHLGLKHCEPIAGSHGQVWAAWAYRRARNR
jgi:hypothetical protein